MISVRHVKVSRLTAGGGRRGAGPGSVSGETALALWRDDMPQSWGRTLVLLPEASAMPIPPNDSWEERATSMRRAVGAAAFVLWEASLPRRRNAVWGRGIAGQA